MSINVTIKEEPVCEEDPEKIMSEVAEIEEIIIKIEPKIEQIKRDPDDQKEPVQETKEHQYVDQRKTEEGEALSQSSPKTQELENQSSIEVKLKDTILTCDICKKKFHRKWNLVRHIDVVHNGKGIKPYKCHVCGKMLSSKFSLAHHLHVHNDNRPFKCDICSKAFRSKSNLSHHIVLHSDRKTFKCNICNKHFKTDIKHHLHTHNNDRPFSCHICNVQFTAKFSLNNHLRQQHSSEKPRHMCEICKRPFGTRYHLKRHKGVHDDERLFPCIICGKRFKYLSTLNRHNKMHEENTLSIHKNISVEYINEEEKNPSSGNNGFEGSRQSEMQIKQEAQVKVETHLYEAHEVKQELLIGPELLQ